MNELLLKRKQMDNEIIIQGYHVDLSRLHILEQIYNWRNKNFNEFYE